MTMAMLRCASLLALLCICLGPPAARAFAPPPAARARRAAPAAPPRRGRPRLPAVAKEDDEACDAPEELSETQQLMQQVKDAGLAGVISYAAWELGFWTLSVPVCVFGYREVTG